MTVEFRPMSDIGGAEVLGVDVLSPIPVDDLAAVEQAFLDFGVLLFREQPMTAQQLAAFSEQFGALIPHVQKNVAIRMYPKW